MIRCCICSRAIYPGLSNVIGNVIVFCQELNALMSLPRGYLQTPTTTWWVHSVWIIVLELQRICRITRWKDEERSIKLSFATSLLLSLFLASSILWRIYKASATCSRTQLDCTKSQNPPFTIDKSLQKCPVLYQVPWLWRRYSLFFNCFRECRQECRHIDVIQPGTTPSIQNLWSNKSWKDGGKLVLHKVCMRKRKKTYVH